ncbi:MAG: DUF4214 domain-containing protein [Desulfobacterales bacterium]|nr:MAG: DUF4214 domain-containing protein [Desulfobacterales bacterium]
MKSLCAIICGLALLLGLPGFAAADYMDDLIRKYYRDILDREPDAAGAQGWKDEIERIVSLNIDCKEGFIALSKFFFNSQEYGQKNKTNEQYVTDLYQTFFNRNPDQGGFAFWVDLLDQGLSRNVLLNYFVYSDEFKLYMANLLGNGPGGAEHNLVNDLYRGFQGRLPDTAGFNGWVNFMQQAISQGEQAVKTLTHQIALGFLQSQEYILRNKSNREFLEDLYNGILRRGAQLAEFEGWIEMMNSGMTREEVLQNFTISTEFQLRVQKIIELGSLEPPQYSGFDFALRAGDFWEFQWDYTRSYWDSFSGGRTSTGNGSFRVTLGNAKEIEGVMAFEVKVSGKSSYDDTNDLMPRWRYLTFVNNQMLGSEDGEKLVTLFDAQSGSWPGSGFFAPFSSSSLITASVGSIENDYISGPAIVIGKSSSESQCEYFSDYGTICGGDYNESDFQKEYYQENIGPIGYYRYLSISDMTSQYPWGSSTTINLGLVACSLRGDTVDYEFETEPNNGPDSAQALTVPAELKGYSSETDEGSTLPALSETSSNDSWDTAQTINLPAVIAGDILDSDASALIDFEYGGSLWYRLAEDWYLLTVPSSTYVNVTLSHSAIPTGSIWFYLFNYTGSSSMGAPVDFEENTSTSKSLSNYLDPGTYLVAVDYVVGISETPSGQRADYTLEVYKGLDSEGGATVEDWYSFTLTNNAQVTLTLTIENSSADCDLYLYNADASSLLQAGNSGGNGQRETIAANLAAGTYVVAVDAVNLSSNYTLTIE